MAKLTHRHQLFDAHTKDLNEMLREPKEIIFCPICQYGFDRRDVDTGIVNTGHVWPDNIGQESKKIRHIQVLLCESCNTKSKKAENQMQDYDTLRRAEASGKLGVRKVKFLDEETGKTIEFRANVEQNSQSLKLSGRVDRDENFLDSDPKNQVRLKAIFMGGKKVNITIEPTKKYDLGKVPAAWITSAYLMAYHALGYRYIFQRDVQTVRDFILNSFENDSKEIDPPKDENFAVERYEDSYYPDPLVQLIFPPGTTAKVYILVSFLDTAVRLPFLYEPAYYAKLLGHIRLLFGEELRKLESDNRPFVLPVNCTKTKAHDCIFDYLLGKKNQ